MKDEPAEAAPKPIPSVARDASYLTRSAVGPKRKSRYCQTVSAVRPTTDIHLGERHVCFVSHKRSFIIALPARRARTKRHAASKFLLRSGAAHFFVDRIKAADEFGIFRYRMGSSNQVALHLVARFSG